MRIPFLLLILATSAPAQVKLTPRDESEIRAVIEAQAKKENEHPSDPLWSERGPLVYAIQRIEGVAENVATADAINARTGSFPLTRNVVFILTRTHGQWTIFRTIEASPRGGFQLISPVGF
jgi:hypothetical protein